MNLAGIAGAPLLDCHKRESVRDVLGTLNGGEIQGDTVQFTARLSPRVADLDDDFAEGFFNKTSVGYSVLGEDPLDMSTNPPTANVTAWRLDEMSVVPVPADDRAAIRAARAAPTPTEPTMTDLEKALSDATTQFTASIMTSVRAAKPAATTPPAETDEQRSAREDAEKAQRDKDAAAATARAKRDDDDGEDGDGGDDEGDDERKRKRAAYCSKVADYRTIIGTRSCPEFDAALRIKASTKHQRSIALGLPPVVGARQESRPRRSSPPKKASAPSAPRSARPGAAARPTDARRLRENDHEPSLPRKAPDDQHELDRGQARHRSEQPAGLRRQRRLGRDGVRRRLDRPAERRGVGQRRPVERSERGVAKVAPVPTGLSLLKSEFFTATSLVANGAGWAKISTAKYVVIVVVGGGGSGAVGTTTAAAYAGGEPGSVEVWHGWASDLPATADIVVGAGGASTSAAGTSNDGTASRFGTVISANGGRGGANTRRGAAAINTRKPPPLCSFRLGSPGIDSSQSAPNAAEPTPFGPGAGGGVSGNGFPVPVVRHPSPVRHRRWPAQPP